MQTIIKEIKDGILKITLNRPDVMNALNTDMLTELNEAFTSAHDDSVRCLVLTGNGKGFCSGQDLKDFQKGNRSFKEILDELYNPLILSMVNLKKPIICGINGVTAGAGMSLALACDFRIAVDNASFIEIFINVGLVTDSGSSFHLPKTVGLSKAFHLCSTAEKLSAKDAYDAGIVQILVSNNDVLRSALDKYAAKFASAPTKALGMIKELLYLGVTSDLKNVLSKEAEYQELSGKSFDYVEGVKAFQEKRKPEFKGY